MINMRPVLSYVSVALKSAPDKSCRTKYAMRLKLFEEHRGSKPTNDSKLPKQSSSISPKRVTLARA
jgi:hypothetical protein